jgi:CheY-like chemotaxis protein
MIDGVEVRVLVADDNDGIRDTTAAILRSVGYAVTEAQDGEVALAELAQKPFHVVVLDERMPKLNGTEVVRTLSPVPPPPVIMMASAYDFDVDLRRQLGTRVFKYLKKPVPPKQLIEAVGAACAGITPPITHRRSYPRTARSSSLSMTTNRCAKALSGCSSLRGSDRSVPVPCRTRFASKPSTDRRGPGRA